MSINGVSRRNYCSCPETEAHYSSEDRVDTDIACRLLTISPSNRTFVDRVLKDAGHTAVTASDGSGTRGTVEEQHGSICSCWTCDAGDERVELARRLREHDPAAKILDLTQSSQRLFGRRVEEHFANLPGRTS